MMGDHSRIVRAEGLYVGEHSVELRMHRSKEIRVVDVVAGAEGWIKLSEVVKLRRGSSFLLNVLIHLNN